MIHLLDDALPDHAACCKVPLAELEALGDKALPDKTGLVNCPQYGWAASLLNE